MKFSEQENKEAVDFISELVKTQGVSYAKGVLEACSLLVDISERLHYVLKLEDTDENVRMCDDIIQDAHKIVIMGREIVLSRRASGEKLE